MTNHLKPPSAIFQDTLPSQVKFSIKYWAPFWRSGYFLPPLEAPKWQRSNHIKNHACPYAVTEIFLLRKCTCLVSLECKKDYNPLGLKPFVSSTAIQLSEAEGIIYSEWKRGPQLSVRESLHIKQKIHWLLISDLFIFICI